MARRSPTNARYQKYTEPKGQTRKSAAAAKPVRKEGGASTTAKAKPKAKGSSGPGGKFYEPDTPEYKFWRRMWWISLGTGLFFVALSFLIQYVLKAEGPMRVAGVVAIGLSYTAIIAAFFIDWRMLRPMRQGTYTAKADKPSTAADSGSERTTTEKVTLERTVTERNSDTTIDTTDTTDDES